MNNFYNAPAVQLSDAGKYAVCAKNTAGETTNYADFVVTDQMPAVIEKRIISTNITDEEVGTQKNRITYYMCSSASTVLLNILFLLLKNGVCFLRWRAFFICLEPNLIKSFRILSQTFYFIEKWGR